MPCPFSSERPDLSVFTRRNVLKQTLALGGASALSACIETRGEPDPPQGSAGPESVPERLYAWNDYLPRDAHGRLVLPRHQLVLLLDLVGKGPPGTDDRGQVELTLQSIEAAYQRGNGGTDPQRPGGSNVSGLLYTLGYSPSYFKRVGGVTPDVAPPLTAETVGAIDEPPGNADEYDAAMVLTSDYVQVLLATELALFGELKELNGINMDASFASVFKKSARRTGFIGAGVPREELGNEEIPRQSPLGMGFVSGFGDNQATESKVAIETGPFAGGTTQHLSRLSLDLNSWYDHDHEERISMMFSPQHTEAEVGTVGEYLANDSGLRPETGAQLEEDARAEGTVGHAQKLAVARDEDFEPLLLRRSEALSADAENPGFNFTSLQRSMDHFVDARRAMNREPEGVSEPQNGIINYLSVESRGNYLVPPRQLAALPPANPS